MTRASRAAVYKEEEEGSYARQVRWLKWAVGREEEGGGHKVSVRASASMRGQYGCGICRRMVFKGTEEGVRMCPWCALQVPGKMASTTVRMKAGFVLVESSGGYLRDV
jgi:hypothetical protein